MSLTLNLPEDVHAALAQKAVETGVPESVYIENLLRKALDLPDREPPQPPQSMYGLWKKYGVSVSAEEIDENRREMFQGFGERDDI